MFPPPPPPSDPDYSSDDTDSSPPSPLARKSVSLPETPGAVGRRRYSSAVDASLNLRDQRPDQSGYIVLDSNRVSVPLRSPHAGSSAQLHSHLTPSVLSSSTSVPDASPLISSSADSSQAHQSTFTGPQINGNAHQLKLTEQALQLNLRTLNLHLSLRVREVLACAEAMWDFVIDYQRQKSPRTSSTAYRPSRFAHSSLSLSGGEYDAIHTALMNMTRYEFDELLMRFEL